MGELSREEFIARFKAEPQLSGIFMVWASQTSPFVIEVELYGAYRYLGHISFYRTDCNFIDWNGVEYAIVRYTTRYYDSYVRFLVKYKSLNDVANFKIKNDTKDAYKECFPNLMEETSWKVFERYRSLRYWLLAGNMDHPKLQGLVYLEKAATERKLRQAIGDSPLPIPIREAIING